MKKTKLFTGLYEDDPFLENVEDFPVEDGIKILSTEPYAKELYNIMAGHVKDITYPDIGDVIEGKVWSLTEDHAFVDVKSKEHGIIELKKENKDYLSYLTPGQTITCLVKPQAKGGCLTLSFTDQVNKQKFNEVLNAIDESSAFPAIIKSVIQDAGYWVDIDGITAFLPGSLAGMNKIIDFNDLIGKELYVMPISYSKDKDSLVVSHKKYLELFVLPNEFKDLKNDKEVLIQGTVTGATSFGVFAEWGSSLTGMIYKSDLNDNYQKMFKERNIKPGHKIEFKIKDLISERKIILTQRYDEKDPWSDVKDKYKENKIYDGKIIKVKDYGIFVELEKNLKGLLLVQNKEELIKLKKGEIIKIRINKIDKESRKIFLGLPKKKRN